MFLGLLLLACPGPSTDAPSDGPDVGDSEGGEELPEARITILEPVQGFSVQEGDLVPTRVSVSVAEAVLRWSVNGIQAPACPSPSDPLACELGGFEEGDAVICVEGDGVGGDCVYGTVRACVRTFWYPDTDGDGYGSGEGAVSACVGAAGTVPIDGDCDDADPSVRPGAVEVCNGRDDDCDSFIDIDSTLVPTWYPDADGDGHGTDDESVVSCVAPAGHVAFGDDCDDADALVNPTRPEVCNGQDDNCNGASDDAAIDADTWYQDEDRDSYGDPATAVLSCTVLLGTVGNGLDCDDGNAAISPSSDETCNNLDEDCDGAIDEDAVDAEAWYADGDSDRYGDASAVTRACVALPGTVADASDCDDTRGTINPAARERCNGADDDCDGVSDEADAIDVTAWYTDADEDGYGDDSKPMRACLAPIGSVADGSDCDDTDAATSPASTERCNDLDDDCDGTIDEDDAADAPVWFEDGDGDGFGDPTAALPSCLAPVGWVADASDCDDIEGAVFPGAMETCDGADEDCDGLTDEVEAADATAWYLDADGDGWGLVDDVTRACEAPAGRAAEAHDCDDASGSSHPSAVELCNGVDDDCDGAIDEDGAADAPTWYDDRDADGYGDPSAFTITCTAPALAIADSADCDDADASVQPGAAELCDGVDDDCDGLVDEPDALDAATWYADADGDGYGAAAWSLPGCTAPDGFVADATDCDDGDATAWPDATEILDATDDDCDGEVDDIPGPWETDLVQNGGFEEGDLTSWTLSTGACQVVTSAEFSWIDTYEGDYMLSGGKNTARDCLVIQTFDLLSLGFTEADLDSGRAGVDAMAVLANQIDVPWFSGSTTYDRTLLRVRYLDEYDTELGSIRTLLSEEDDWAVRGTGGILPEGTRTLVVEVEGKLRKGLHVDAVADSVSMSVTTNAPVSPAIVSLPFLQDFRQDAMRLLWETDGNMCDNVIEWAPTGEPLTNVVTLIDTVEVDADHFVHVGTIEGLEAGQSYDYRVGSGDTWSATYTFRTAPPDGQPLKIGWVGDNEWGSDTFTGFLQGMLDRNVDLYVSPGDVVWNGDEVDDWRNEWLAPLEVSNFSQTRPVLFARGNHDNHRSLAYAYSALPENEDWYSFSYGNLFFVVLDSNAPSDSSTAVLSQMEYLEDALASEAALLADFRIVVFHNPPYTNARHDDVQIGFRGAQNDWVPLLESYNVDLVIGGHYHSYQRATKNDVTYLVVGGGGGYLDDRTVELYDFFDVVELTNHYAMMEVDGPTLTWTAYDEDDAELDTFTLVAD